MVISTQTINSGGSITSLNVEIFNNFECTEPCTNINWGTINPGSSTNQTIFIKNTGNKPITLYLTSDNWIPSNVSTYMNLFWNRENAILNPDQTTSATLVLTTNSNINSIDDFGFEIIIIGVE